MEGVTIRNGLLTGGADGAGILNSGTLELVGVTLDSNDAASIGGQGGAIYNQGSLTMTDSLVTNNIVYGGGAGLFNGLPFTSGITATISNTMFDNNNSTAASGGAIFDEVDTTLTVTGGTFTNNFAAGNGGAIHNSGGPVTISSSLIDQNSVRIGANGGGLSNTSIGVMIVTSSTISRNSSERAGGTYNIGLAQLTLLNSTVTNNTAVNFGGGLVHESSGTVTITDTVLSNNSAGTDGGGVFQAGGTLNVSRSLLSNNDAGQGGGAYVYDSSASFVNSTLTGNVANEGGGLYVFRPQGADVTFVNSTVTLNVAVTGGGIQNIATVNLKNSLIAANSASSGADLHDNGGAGTFNSLGNNLIGILDGAVAFADGVNGDKVGSSGSPLDPQVGPLRDNGGPTLTHALMPNSPAIDAGDNTGVPALEQRGVARITDGDGDGTATVDIGAVEFGFVVDTAEDTVDANPGDGVARDASGNTSLRAAVMEANVLAGHQTILLADGVFTLSIAGAGEDQGETGDLDIKDTSGSLTIVGLGAGTTTIDGAGLDRVLHIANGAALGLVGLTIAGGDGGNGFGDSGGGILNAGTLALSDSEVSNNTAFFGGGINNAATATATVTATVFTGNTADVGGAIYDSGASLTITDSTFSGNQASGVGPDDGGAIYTTGSVSVTITGSTFSNNTAGGGGGGVSIGGNGGRMTILDTTISSNSAEFGGGIITGQNAILTIIDSTISDNQTTGGGGSGIYNGDTSASLTISGSTVSGNSGTGTGSLGGGIRNQGWLTVTNTTISRNATTLDGGGIYNSSPNPVTVINSTIADNTASFYGGVLHVGTGSFSVTNTIIADNVTSGAFTSGGHNLIGAQWVANTSGFTNGVNGDIVGTSGSPIDAMLGPLQDNGGPTFTHNLLPGSPAIDAGSNAGATTTDQRGAPRIINGLVDIGAFESGFVGFFVDSEFDAVDAIPGDGVAEDALGRTTLRAAIMESNALGGSRSIALPAGTYRLAIPGAGEQFARTGDLDITAHIAIFGVGRDITVIDAAGLDRAFYVRPGGMLDISGITITGGDTTASQDDGGAIANEGILSVSDSLLTTNFAFRDGGAISTNSVVTINRSVLSDNTTNDRGGAVYGTVFGSSPVVTINDSTLSDNTALTYGGGGVFVYGGDLIVNDSIVTDNTARTGGGISVTDVDLIVNRSSLTDNIATNRGGGIYSDGVSATSSVMATTLAGNSAVDGGGIYNRQGTFDLTNSTLSFNSATTFCGGICVENGVVTILNGTITGNSSPDAQIAKAAGTINVGNSIIAGNPATTTNPDVRDAFNSLGGNLIGNGGGSAGFTHGVDGDQVGTSPSPIDPLLGPLQDNGGPTLTHLPLPGSPAIDRGNNAGAPATDQVGSPRPQDGDDDGTATVDIGAVEVYFGEILGVKFHDLNGNGVRDLGEPGLAGWTIYLDDNNNGLLDPGEESSLTDQNGIYSFTELPPQVTYRVAEQFQTGWRQTAPALSDFSAATNLADDATAQNMVTGDFNEDGLTDLAVAETSTRFSFFANNGDGTFSRTQSEAGRELAYGLAKGDFNADGHLDLAVAVRNRASVMLGDGQGNFAIQGSVQYGFDIETPVALLAADLDGDGDLDLVAVNNGSRNLSYLINDGAGNLSDGGDSADLGMNPAPQSVAVGDMNGDGQPDLVITLGLNGWVALSLNDGNGGFLSQSQIAVAQNPRVVLLADVDRDGDLDAVIADYNANEVLVSRNDGQGNFAASANVAVGIRPYGMTTLDVDGDGDLDLAVSNNESHNLTLLVNDGTGTFSLSGTFETGLNPDRIVAADFDGDELPDLVVSNGGSISLHPNHLQQAHSIFVLPGTIVTDRDFGTELTLSISDPQLIDEGDNGTKSLNFQVTLSSASSVSTTVGFRTAPGTAVADVDYVSTSGSLTFDPGETTKTVVVTINGDTTDEFDETFFVDLFNAVNARIDDGQARATIADDDALPLLSIGDLTVDPEGDQGSQDVEVTITLSAASGRDVTVQFATQDDTANAGSDYTHVAGSVTFAAGQTSQKIMIPVIGDFDYEPGGERFRIKLTNPDFATLADDEAVITIPDDDPLLTVTSTLDKVDVTPGDGAATTGTPGEITLRAAIMEANSLAGPDRIILPAGVYTLTRAGADEDLTRTGDFDVTDKGGFLLIQGAGADVTFIDAANLDRVFHVLPGTELRLVGVTVRNGNVIGGSSDAGGGAFNEDGTLTIIDSVFTANQGARAGAIDNDGALTITGSTFTLNQAEQAGAIRNDGGATLSISDSLFANNSAIGGNSPVGGAIRNSGTIAEIRRVVFQGNQAKSGAAIHSSGSLMIVDSTFDQNDASSDGGAIYDQAISSTQVVIVNSTFSANTAAKDGGAIYHRTSNLQVTNSSFGNNHADGNGGALFNDSGTLGLLHVTIADNSTLGLGGGIVNGGIGVVEPQNSLIAKNLANGGNPDVSGNFASGGHNLIGDAGAATGFGAAGDLLGNSAAPINPRSLHPWRITAAQREHSGCSKEARRSMPATTAIPRPRINAANLVPRMATGIRCWSQISVHSNCRSIGRRWPMTSPIRWASTRRSVRSWARSLPPIPMGAH